MLYCVWQHSALLNVSIGEKEKDEVLDREKEEIGQATLSCHVFSTIQYEESNYTCIYVKIICKHFSVQFAALTPFNTDM